MTIKLGGSDTERLYLQNDAFTFHNEQVFVKRSNFAGVDMDSVIARHRGRYFLAASFVRPRTRILDFPCGSGYGSEILTQAAYTTYLGLDFDPVTIAYATRNYERIGGERIQFCTGDLTKPDLPEAGFEFICCLEGLEHIEKAFQLPLLQSLHKALVPGGRLVISSPVNPTGISGKSEHNPDHLWELSEPDFINLVADVFGVECIQYISLREQLSTRVTTEFLYAICQKE